MRRSNNFVSGNLDLLLDTICNAFGGIVFIALLLAVLTQNIPDATTSAYDAGTLPPSVLKLRGDLRMLEEEIERLQAQIDEQEEPEKKRDLSEIDREFVELRAKLISLEQVSQSSADEVARIKNELAEARSEIKSTSGEIEKISAQMLQRKEKLTKIKRLPVSQPSPPGMGQYWMVVQKGRLHLISSLDSGKGYYPDVRILEESSTHELVTVREERGQVMKPGAERFGLLQTFFEATSPNRVVVQVMVDTESFKEFNFLKDQLVDKGYRYFFDIGGLPIRFVEGSDFENF
jgi:hypothetical protein